MATKLNRIVFYCPDELQAKIEDLAKKDNRSMSNLIVTLLQRFFEEESIKKEILNKY